MPYIFPTTNKNTAAYASINSRESTLFWGGANFRNTEPIVVPMLHDDFIHENEIMQNMAMFDSITISFEQLHYHLHQSNHKTTLNKPQNRLLPDYWNVMTVGIPDIQFR